MEKQLENRSDLVPEEAGLYLLRCSLAGDGAVSGVIRRFFCDRSEPFSGLDQAVLLIDGWLSGKVYTPEKRKLRMFSSVKEARSGAQREEAAPAAGDMCAGTVPIGSEAFLIRVYYRRHTSWQGTVRWREQEVPFRSSMELMYLMRTALERCAGSRRLRDTVPGRQRKAL